MYSLRLEKLFKQAYPSSSIEKSSTLREQYLNTIPSNIKSKLKEHLFNNKLNGKSTTWSEIQRYARFRDVMLEEQECEKSNSDSDKDTEVIEVNTGRAIKKKIPDTDMQVEYDKGNKKFFIVNPGMINLKPPDVQFSRSFHGSNSRGRPRYSQGSDNSRPQFHQNQNYRHQSQP